MIKCEQDDCIHFNHGYCEFNDITISDMGICLEFEDYSMTDEYSQKYYISVRTKDGQLLREPRLGKKIEINGIVFFTSSSSQLSDDKIFLTHGRTGYACGSITSVKENFDKFLSFMSDKVDVMTLPLREEYRHDL